MSQNDMIIPQNDMAKFFRSIMLEADADYGPFGLSASLRGKRLMRCFAHRFIPCQTARVNGRVFLSHSRDASAAAKRFSLALFATAALGLIAYTWKKRKNAW